MPVKSEIPLELKPLRLFKGDFEKIQRLHPTLGAAVAIRALVRNYIKRAEAAATKITVDLPDNILEDILND